MPVEAKPLFRPEVIRKHLAGFQPPPIERDKLGHWAAEIGSGRIDQFGEHEILRSFLIDVFVGLLGYRQPVGNDRFTISFEKHVQAEGAFADAVLGDYNGQTRHLVVIEGKGPRDPLTRPFAGRKVSAVDQAYKYAINLRCNWAIVTSIRETRLYHKGSDTQTYERFETRRLADDEAALHRFLFLLGADRVTPAGGVCHLDGLLGESEQVGRELTKSFYVEYADIRQDAFEQLSADNPAVPRRDVLTATQKLLDRVLFTAFCEDRSLLPPDTLRKAYEHSDPYHPRPTWENFRSLFRSIDIGNPALKIDAYNGGLFALDPVLDSLVVSDEVCGYFRDLGAYEYGSPSDADKDAKVIDVDILGHIFEQSITDLEQLRNEIEGLAEPSGPAKHKTRRKKEGAFYTPAFATRYIVEQALGGVLADRFERLRHSQQRQVKGSAEIVLRDPSGTTSSRRLEPADHRGRLAASFIASCCVGVAT